MSTAISIQNLDQLMPFVNDDGFLEIVTRTKKKKFYEFYNVFFDKAQQDEVAEAVVEKLANKDFLQDFDTSRLASMANLNQFSLVLQAANLGATIAGFAIMYSKLNRISDAVAGVVNILKSNETAHINFEYNKVLSVHRDMLDCRKKQREYTEEQMRELVDSEYNVLNLLVETFMNEASTNRLELYQSILGLAQMLSVSLKHFDEVYYYANKNAIKHGEKWHASHDAWVGIFDILSSNEMIEKVQDFGMFDLNLSTPDNDYLYVNYREQMKGLKQEVEDNQALIEMCDDNSVYDTTINAINKDIENDIINLFQEIDVPPEFYSEPLRVIVA